MPHPTISPGVRSGSIGHSALQAMVPSSAAASDAHRASLASAVQVCTGSSAFFYINILLIFLIIFFPLRERRIEFLAGQWWARVLFLGIIVLVATYDAGPCVPTSTITLTAMLLGALFVLATNTFLARHLPLAPGVRAETGATGEGENNGSNARRQVAAVRHRQYADLMERCLNSDARKSYTCRELRKVHRAVNALHNIMDDDDADHPRK